MLKQRVITALMLAALVTAAIWFLPPQYFALAALVFMVGVGAWEWGALTGIDGSLPGAVMPTIAMTIGGALLLFNLPLLPVLLLSVVVWGGVIYLLFNYQQDTQLYANQPYLLRISGLLVLLPAWYALVHLHGMHYGYVFYVIALVAVADSGAYFTGKRFGKTKLAPSLSPGKTREGVYGGLVLTLLWALLGVFVGGHGGLNGVLFVLFSMLAVVLSVLGDLFESLVKREAGAKDSGSLLPGHGGVLDRIDGLLAALPVFTLGLLWIGSGVR